MVEGTEECLICSGHIVDMVDGVWDTRFGLSDSYTYKQCYVCGTAQIHPIPSQEKLHRLYEAHYNYKGVGKKVRFYERVREKFPFRLWSLIDGDLSFHTRKFSGRLLEIGCNEGRNLTLYKMNGAQAEGLEINREAAAVARSRGHTVHVQPLESFVPVTLYDAVALPNALEHFTNPHEVLSFLGRLIRPGGEIWVSVPNVNSWQRHVFRRYWINWHPPFHIFHFSARSLTRLLEKHGFSDILIDNVSPSMWLGQSFLSTVFSKRGQPTLALRNPFLIGGLLLLGRFLFFPALWIGNLMGAGDCLVVTAIYRATPVPADL